MMTIEYSDVATKQLDEIFSNQNIYNQHGHGNRTAINDRSKVSLVCPIVLWILMLAWRFFNFALQNYNKKSPSASADGEKFIFLQIFVSFFVILFVISYSSKVF